MIVALDTNRITYRLEPSMNASWLFLDLFAVLPVAIAVDVSTQAWNDFGDQSIVYWPDSLDPTRQRVLTELPTADRKPPIGILFRGGFGVSGPVSQIVMFFNQYAVDLGYFVTDDVAILAHHAHQGCIAHQGFEGTTGHRPDPYCFTSSRHTTLDAHVRVGEGMYATAGGGIATVRSDTVVVLPRWTRAPGFNETIPIVSAGIGYSGKYFFVEYRHHFGLEAIPIGGDVTGSFSLWTIHFGLNATF